MGGGRPPGGEEVLGWGEGDRTVERHEDGPQGCSKGLGGGLGRRGQGGAGANTRGTMAELLHPAVPRTCQRTRRMHRWCGYRSSLFRVWSSRQSTHRTMGDGRSAVRRRRALRFRARPGNTSWLVAASRVGDRMGRKSSGYFTATPVARGVSVGLRASSGKCYEGRSFVVTADLRVALRREAFLDASEATLRRQLGFVRAERRVTGRIPKRCRRQPQIW